MLSQVTTFAIDGVQPRQVWLEVDIRAGLPGFTIVGLGDTAVRESRDRIRAAILNSRFRFPDRRITANLAPASLRKAGPGFDAGLALGVLAASDQLPAASLDGCAVFGELSLGGELRDSPGALAVAEGASRAGCTRLIVPRERAREAALVSGLEVIAVATLARGGGRARRAPAPPRIPRAEPVRARPSAPPDLADVRGQEVPLLALADRGGGRPQPPDGGRAGNRQDDARPSAAVDPAAAVREEAIEVTRIHSVAGIHARGSDRRRGRSGRRITRSRRPGSAGGASPPRPGEATLAHHLARLGVPPAERVTRAAKAGAQPPRDAPAVGRDDPDDLADRVLAQQRRVRRASRTTPSSSLQKNASRLTSISARTRSSASAAWKLQ